MNVSQVESYKSFDNRVGPHSRPWILVFGPTGSGKSQLAIRLAQEISYEFWPPVASRQGQILQGDSLPFSRASSSSADANVSSPCVILSCDSVALYRGFDIGTAKPSMADRKGIPHACMDAVAWNEPFDADDYATLGRQIMEELWCRRALPLVVGGTGLYLRALQGERFDQVPGAHPDLRAQLQSWSSEALLQRLRDLNPQRAREVHPNDRVRLIRGIEIALLSQENRSPEPPKAHQALWVKPLWTIALDPPRSILHQRIAIRTQEMLTRGLVDEVEKLLSQGVDPGCKPMQSIGYKQVCEVLLGQSPLHGLEERIMAATRQYAKRQCTWFKRLPRDVTLSDGDQLGAVDWTDVRKHLFNYFGKRPG